MAGGGSGCWRLLVVLVVQVHNGGGGGGDGGNDMLSMMMLNTRRTTVNVGEVFVFCWTAFVQVKGGCSLLSFFLILSSFTTSLIFSPSFYDISP